MRLTPTQRLLAGVALKMKPEQLASLLSLSTLPDGLKGTATSPIRFLTLLRQNCGSVMEFVEKLNQMLSTQASFVDLKRVVEPLYRLCDNDDLSKTEFPKGMARYKPTDAQMRDFNATLLKISDNVPRSCLDIMVTLAPIPDSKKEVIMVGHVLFNAMKQCGCISENDSEFLMDLLQELQLVRCVEILEDYKNTYPQIDYPPFVPRPPVPPQAVGGSHSSLPACFPHERGPREEIHAGSQSMMVGIHGYIQPFQAGGGGGGGGTGSNSMPGGGGGGGGGGGFHSGSSPGNGHVPASGVQATTMPSFPHQVSDTRTAGGSSVALRPGQVVATPPMSRPPAFKQQASTSESPSNISPSPSSPFPATGNGRGHGFNTQLHQPPQPPSSAPPPLTTPTSGANGPHPAVNGTEGEDPTPSAPPRQLVPLSSHDQQAPPPPTQPPTPPSVPPRTGGGASPSPDPHARPLPPQLPTQPNTSTPPMLMGQSWSRQGPTPKVSTSSRRLSLRSAGRGRSERGRDERGGGERGGAKGGRAEGGSRAPASRQGRLSNPPGARQASRHNNSTQSGQFPSPVGSFGASSNSSASSLSANSLGEPASVQSVGSSLSSYTSPNMHLSASTLPTHAENGSHIIAPLPVGQAPPQNGLDINSFNSTASSYEGGGEPFVVTPTPVWGQQGNNHFQPNAGGMQPPAVTQEASPPGGGAVGVAPLPQPRPAGQVLNKQRATQAAGAEYRYFNSLNNDVTSSAQQSTNHHHHLPQILQRSVSSGGRGAVLSKEDAMNAFGVNGPFNSINTAVTSQAAPHPAATPTATPTSASQPRVPGAEEEQEEGSGHNSSSLSESGKPVAECSDKETRLYPQLPLPSSEGRKRPHAPESGTEEAKKRRRTEPLSMVSRFVSSVGTLFSWRRKKPEQESETLTQESDTSDDSEPEPASAREEEEEEEEYESCEES